MKEKEDKCTYCRRDSTGGLHKDHDSRFWWCYKHSELDFLKWPLIIGILIFYYDLIFNN